MRVPSSASRPTPWVRLVAALGLAAYVAGLGWFAALFTATLALWDGGHSVRIESRTDGLRVVLGHDRLHGADRPHHLLASALAAWAGPTSDKASDHVIRFGPGAGIVAKIDSDGAPRQPTASAIVASPVVPVHEPACRAIPGFRVEPGRPFVVAVALRVARTHVIRC